MHRTAALLLLSLIRVSRRRGALTITTITTCRIFHAPISFCVCLLRNSLERVVYRPREEEKKWCSTEQKKDYENILNLSLPSQTDETNENQKILLVFNLTRIFLVLTNASFFLILLRCVNSSVSLIRIWISHEKLSTL